MTTLAEKYGIGKREIKFRLWDIGLKVMITPEMLCDHCYNGECKDFFLELERREEEELGISCISGTYLYQACGYLGDTNFDKSLMCAAEYLKDLSDRKVDMQYTGLRDKNGVEIYEGDIVKDYDGNVSVIVYESAIARFRIPSLAITGVFCEVIGNIFENPEIMESINEEEK